MVSDPQYNINQTPPLNNTEQGCIGWFNSYHLDQVSPPAPTVVAGYYYGSAAHLRDGAYVIGGGDFDLGSSLGSPVSGSWDFRWGSGLVTNAIGINEFTFQTDPVDTISGDNTLTLSTYGWTDVLIPSILHPDYGTASWEGSEHANQMASVGDIGIDSGPIAGVDDFAYVAYAKNTVLHEVHVAVGNSNNGGSAPPTDIYLFNVDPVTQLPLHGTNGYNRTSVSTLGDVDGDGVDDFGVVTGHNGAGGTVNTLLFVVGSNGFGTSPHQGDPGIVGNKPRLRGNKFAQRGSRISLIIDNCTAGASLTLYENTSLMNPGIPACGGVRTVGTNGGGVSYSLTANAQGEAFFNRDLLYSPSSSKELPGNTWYYQVVETFPGPTGCALSNVWAFDIIDTSRPLDEYPGDS